MGFEGTVTEEHVQAVNDSVKKAFRERPSMFAHELLKCEVNQSNRKTEALPHSVQKFCSIVVGLFFNG